MNSNTDVLETETSTDIAANAPTLTAWTLDSSHTNASFTVRHMMITNVRGDFREMSGTLQLDREHIERSSVHITIDASTIETHEPQRDAHLKSADFFDVEKYPTLTFFSTAWEQKSKDELVVRGDLTVHGVTNEVTLAVDGPTQEITDPYGRTKLGFSATTKINRKDFGLTWNAALEAGGLVVSDEVKIAIDAQFIKK